MNELMSCIYVYASLKKKISSKDSSILINPTLESKSYYSMDQNMSDNSSLLLAIKLHLRMFLFEFYSINFI